MNILSTLGSWLLSALWALLALVGFCVAASALFGLCEYFRDRRLQRKVRHHCSQCGELDFLRGGYCRCCKWVFDNQLGLAQSWNTLIYEIHVLRQTMKGLR